VAAWLELLLTCESKTKRGVYVTPLTTDASWRKSSHSGGEGGNCVELRNTFDAVRDSKRRDGAVLRVRGLPVLIDAVKAGRFDG
jgi:Domain of unknown function (DUF397)